MADVAERGWKRRFNDPIPLSHGREPVTPGPITKFPKTEHEDPARFRPDAILPHQGTQVQIA
jgi:hypothetical protein